MSSASARVDELKKRYEENPRRFFAPLANEYRKAGDLDAAIDLCRTHLDEQPGHLSGHIVYGQALYESGRSGDAKVTFEAALNLDPENLIALRHLGDIAKAGSDFSTATHWYQRVLDADPRNDEVIALITDMQRASTSTVVIVDEPPPPPAPQYAAAAPGLSVDLPFIDPSAPTPVVAIDTVEPPPAPPSAPPQARGSIGLMDLDLDLGEPAVAAGGLLGDLPAAPAEPFGDSSGASFEEPAPEPAAELAAEEPTPVFEMGFPLADAHVPATFEAAPDLLGAEDIHLGLDRAEDPVIEVQDASFGADVPYEEPTTFSSTDVEPAFGDSLDITMPDDLVAAPIAETAAPTPTAPSPSDFDALFGNAPIADVHIGGDDAPMQTEDAGFVTEAYIGREPIDASLDAPSDIGTTTQPFVTETMAELYLQQGFREEALAVYRQLLAQNPDDAGLAERVLHLERGSRSSLAIDSVSEAMEAAALGASVEAPIEAIAEAPVETADAAVVPDEPAHDPFYVDTTPAFLVQGPPPVAVVPEPVAPVGPTAREIFARIALRHAVPGGGAGMSPNVEPVTEPAPLPAVDPSWGQSAVTNVAYSADVQPAAVATAPGGSIDQLFGMGGVGTDDEGAASAVSAAFAAAPVADIKGAPTRAGHDELTLDNVFRDESAPRPAVDRRSTKLRFDQFFAPAEEESPSSPSSASTLTPPSASGTGEEDIAQFSDWLKGLKGS